MMQVWGVQFQSVLKTDSQNCYAAHLPNCEKNCLFSRPILFCLVFKTPLPFSPSPFFLWPMTGDQREATVLWLKLNSTERLHWTFKTLFSISYWKPRSLNKPSSCREYFMRIKSPKVTPTFGYSPFHAENHCSASSWAASLQERLMLLKKGVGCPRFHFWDLIVWPCFSTVVC